MTREDGKCAFTHDHPIAELQYPIKLTPDMRRALDIHEQTLDLSGVDSYGLPTLEKLELVLALRKDEWDRNELSETLKHIPPIHQAYRKIYAQKLKELREKDPQ